MQFDDAWCICTQRRESGSVLVTLHSSNIFIYSVHTHTLAYTYIICCLRILHAVGGSHARLKGAVNDAWNMYTLLRLGLKRQF